MNITLTVSLQGQNAGLDANISSASSQNYSNFVQPANLLSSSNSHTPVIILVQIEVVL
jgi:hypothetical protein